MSKKKEPGPKKTVTYSIPEPDPDQGAMAEIYLHPNFNTSFALASVSPRINTPDGYRSELEIEGAFSALTKANARIKSGNLEEIKTLLANQIRLLDRLFNDHVRKAHQTERLDLLKAHSNIAFTAQRQCRTTAEALAEIKNPMPYIQNNRAQYQQVNNGQATPAGNFASNTRGRAHEGENPKTTNGLLEDRSHEWMDTGATQTTGGDDTELEAVGAVDRAED